MKRKYTLIGNTESKRQEYAETEIKRYCDSGNDTVGESGINRVDYEETEINRYSDSDYETVAGTWTGI